MIVVGRQRQRGVEPAARLGKEIPKGSIVVGDAVTAGRAMGESPDQVSSVAEKEAGPAAAAFRDPLAPLHRDGVGHAERVEVVCRGSGRELLEISSRMVDPVCIGRVVDGQSAPPGEPQPSRRRFPEAQQRQIVTGAGGQQIGAAGGPGKAAVLGAASAGLALKEPPGFHRARDASRRYAVPRRQEIELSRRYSNWPLTTGTEPVVVDGTHVRCMPPCCHTATPPDPAWQEPDAGCASACTQRGTIRPTKTAASRYRTTPDRITIV